MNPEQFRQDIVFGNKWFEKYQSRLLFLLNNKWTKRWFRYCLRIRKCDCKLDTVINKISPNSFSYGGKYINEETIELTTDFRTHDKYSKRLYFAFKPFWYLLHFFDWAMLDRVEQLTKLSFGFSTLTAYPETTGANDPVNGTVGRTSVSESWATLKAGAGNDNSGGGSGYIMWSATASNPNFWGMGRMIFCFNTSALTAGATISATVMSLNVISVYHDGGWSPTFDIYTSTPAATNALANADFTEIGTTSQTGSPIAYASLATSAYNDFTFSATGRGNVSKTGISKFAAREAVYDVGSSTPAWGSFKSMEINISLGSGTGASPDPKLVVTYTAAVGPANLKSYNTNLKANIKSINTNLIANVKSLDTNV